MGSLGRDVVGLVIQFAQLLTKSEGAPGWVALGLLIVLILVTGFFIRKTSMHLRSIAEMQSQVLAHNGIPEFSENYDDFKFKLEENKRKSKSWSALWQAWDEFSETIVPDDVEEPTVLRNSIRPGTFLNVDDLGFGAGLYRNLPNVFVSTGLLLTFLGLVAALATFAESLSTQDIGMDSAMRTFMQIASAKFIMSLVGLACSIIFGMVLRHRLDQIERRLQNLCMAIERRLRFVSLEDIGFRQLKAATEQREHLREIGFSMVAELTKPLEALPEKITQSISDKMDPIFERVGNMGTSSMEGLVGDLSSQLTHSVGNALNNASQSLGEASDRIGAMVDRMNSSNSQASDGLQTALAHLATSLEELKSNVSETGQTASAAMNEGAEKLLSVMNETLAGIRDNTSQGAHAMSAAAEEMRKAAEGFRSELAAAAEDGAAAARSQLEASSANAGAAINGAGKSVLEAFEATSERIAKVGTDLGDKMGVELLGSIEDLNQQLAKLANGIEQSAGGARDAASGLSRTANAITEASNSFTLAGRTMFEASEPITNSHERIEREMQHVSLTVKSVSDTLLTGTRQLVENARNILDTAQTGLGTEREGIRQSLEATRAALSQISSEAEKLDQIDEMLGRALQGYSEQLEAALGSAQEHITQMRDTLAPGIDVLRGVVEQAESFMPAQPKNS
jgi:ElaB/YqjD/DUF883 family membrane-anchored ribosome-binding protein